MTEAEQTPDPILFGQDDLLARRRQPDLDSNELVGRYVYRRITD